MRCEKSYLQACQLEQTELSRDASSQSRVCFHRAGTYHDSPLTMVVRIDDYHEPMYTAQKIGNLPILCAECVHLRSSEMSYMFIECEHTFRCRWFAYVYQNWYVVGKQLTHSQGDRNSLGFQQRVLTQFKIFSRIVISIHINVKLWAYKLPLTTEPVKKRYQLLQELCHSNHCFSVPCIQQQVYPIPHTIKSQFCTHQIKSNHFNSIAAQCHSQQGTRHKNEMRHWALLEAELILFQCTFNTLKCSRTETPT